jgi:Flp pilus assembly protein TadD
LFLYGIPQSSTPVPPQPNWQILQSPSVETPSKSNSVSNGTSEPSQILNELYGKIEQGREQLKNKNFGLARTEFKAAQALDNHHPLPLFYIGIAYDRAGNIDEADRNYEEAGKKYLAFQGKSKNLRPYDYDALIELSHVFNKDKKHESALELSSLALELQGISPKKRYAAYATKGTSLFWLDRSESDRLEARDAFVDALEIKESHLVRYNLGSLYAKLLKDNPNAEKEYSRALQLKPDFKQALRDLGFLYIIMNRLPEAESMFKQIQDDALAQEGLQIVSSLRTASQTTVLADIQRLGIFGSLTVHDFEQDPVLKDEHDHDH